MRRRNKQAKKVVARFPGKEELVDLEQIAKRQKRVYPDAIDVGIVLDKSNKKKIKPVWAELQKLYGATITKYGTGQMTEIFVPVEMDGPYVSGIIVTLIYSNDKPRNMEVLSISFKRDNLKPDAVGKKYRKSKKGELGVPGLDKE